MSKPLKSNKKQPIKCRAKEEHTKKTSICKRSVIYNIFVPASAEIQYKYNSVHFIIL